MLRARSFKCVQTFTDGSVDGGAEVMEIGFSKKLHTYLESV